MINEIKQLFKYHIGNQDLLASHDLNQVYKQTITDLNRNIDNFELSNRKILDLGCGQRYPFSLLCSLNNANVTALDIDYVKPGNIFMMFFKILYYNGFKRFLKTVFRKLFLDASYYSKLTGQSKKAIKKFKNNISFILFDPLVEKYPLESNAFDLICSNAVLEHVNNVDLFAKELYRLLKNGGVFYGIIHNYYSISGGHNLEMAFPDTKPSAKIPPWDHLLDNKYPTFIYLNKLKPEEYKRIFSKYFDVLLFKGCGLNHVEGELEGISIYEHGIDERLKKYPKNLLTTRAYKILIMKK